MVYDAENIGPPDNGVRKRSARAGHPIVPPTDEIRRRLSAERAGGSRGAFPGRAPLTLIDRVHEAAVAHGVKPDTVLEEALGLWLDSR